MNIYEEKFKIGVEDIDKNRKIKNQAILRMFQDTAGMHSEKVHFGINDIDRTRLSWIVLNWTVHVERRPEYNEIIKVKTWIRETNKIFMYRDFEMYDEKGNTIIIATSQWAFINVDTNKLTKLPKETIDAYGTENESAFKNRTVKKIREPLTYSKITEYKILRKDIDINEHVHNINYLDIAYEALPYDIYIGSEFNNIEILYKKQIKYDDKINSFYQNEKDENIIAIKSKDEKTLHAIIKLY